VKKNDYSKLRFQSETVLVKILEEDFAIKNYYDIFENKDELKQIVNQLLSDSVKFNRCKCLFYQWFWICSSHDLLDFCLSAVIVR